MLIGLIPVFNEEENVIEVLDRLKKQVDCIIIVNDGSTDRSDYLIKDWAKHRKDIHYLFYPKNRGMSYALLMGFNYIYQQYKEGKFQPSDLAITMDADGQHDPNDINSMYGYFNKNNLDVLIAKRDFFNYPKYRIFGNRLMSWFGSWLGKFRFEDIECGFKILKVSFIIDLLDYYIGYRYSCAGEIAICASRLGYKIDNQYPLRIPYYRKKGPGFIDFFINMIFYQLIVLKTKFRKR